MSAIATPPSVEAPSAETDRRVSECNAPDRASDSAVRKARPDEIDDTGAWELYAHWLC